MNIYKFDNIIIIINILQLCYIAKKGIHYNIFTIHFMIFYLLGIITTTTIIIATKIKIGKSKKTTTTTTIIIIIILLLILLNKNRK